MLVSSRQLLLLALVRRPRPEVECTVVQVQFVQRVGPAVAGSPCVLGDEAAQLHIIGVADELV